jgi:hypothetical protein
MMPTTRVRALREQASSGLFAGHERLCCLQERLRFALHVRHGYRVEPPA